MKKFLTVITILIVIGTGIFIGIKTIDKEDIKNYVTPSKVFITGNIHGKLDIKKISEENFTAQRGLKPTDNLIILGDFGLIWDENIEDEMELDNLDKKNFNILFVDGSHENFTLLNKFEEVEIYGGKAHKIRDNIFHLMRGESYTIGGSKYLVFGGGESEDKAFREKGESYWIEEIPNSNEWGNLKENIIKNNHYFDYVLTYSPPSSDLKMIGAMTGKNLGSGNEINKNLEIIKGEIKYKKWFHSYYHLDVELSKKDISIYNNIIELK